MTLESESTYRTVMEAVESLDGGLSPIPCRYIHQLAPDYSQEHIPTGESRNDALVKLHKCGKRWRF